MRKKVIEVIGASRLTAKRFDFSQRSGLTSHSKAV